MSDCLTEQELKILGTNQEMLDDTELLDEVSSSVYFLDSCEVSDVVSSLLCGSSLF